MDRRLLFASCICHIALSCVSREDAQTHVDPNITRSARIWTLPDGTRLKAKIVAENDRVVLLECGRLYSRTSFSGELLFRTARLGVDGQRIATRLHDSLPRARAVALPGDQTDISSADVESMISLAQISIGLFNHVREHGRFPQRAIYSDSGKPLLSWRVRILPYVGEFKIYEEFHLDEPWDSPHNRKLIKKIPYLYAGTNTLPDGRTRYLVPVNKATMWEGRGGLTVKHILDGTSRTIAVVQTTSQHAVTWTKPADLEFDPQCPRAGLAEPNTKGFSAGFADGHAAFLSNELDTGTLNAYFTRSGHEIVPMLDGPKRKRPQ